MSKEAFEAIKAGLEDALAYAEGDRRRGQAHRVALPEVDVSAIRAKLHMTQEEFARTVRVSIGTLRNWEQNRRRPEGPALVLLNALSADPKSVMRAIGQIPTVDPKASHRR